MKTVHKIVLIFGLFIVFGGGAWYAIKNVQKPDNIAPINTENKSISNNEKSVTQNTNTEMLQKEALKIVVRPIVVTAALSEANKKNAIANIEEANKMIKENFDTDAPWLVLGAYRKVIGDFDGAIEAWNFLGIIRPKGFVSFHNLGELYGFYLKNYPKSEENFLKSIANNPSNFDAYSQLTTVYEAFEPQATEKLLLDGIQKNPSAPVLHIMLGEYYAKIGKKFEALNHLEAALKLDQSNEALKKEIEALKS